MIFEKIREKIEEKAFSVQLKQGIKEPSTFDAMAEKFSVREIKDIINQVEVEYKDVLSNMYYHSNFERRINEVIPMLESQLLYGTISLIKDLKAENDILRSYLPQPPKGE